MLGDLFWRSTDHKKRVNEKDNVEIDNPVSSGGQRKCMKYVSFPWLPLEATLSIFNVKFLLKTGFFCEGINTKEGDCHNAKS
jgi:hypothetical protein